MSRRKWLIACRTWKTLVEKCSKLRRQLLNSKMKYSWIKLPLSILICSKVKALITLVIHLPTKDLVTKFQQSLHQDFKLMNLQLFLLRIKWCSLIRAIITDIPTITKEVESCLEWMEIERIFTCLMANPMVAIKMWIKRFLKMTKKISLKTLIHHRIMKQLLEYRRVI